METLRMLPASLPQMQVLIIAAVALAAGWLIRHRGFGRGLLPGLSCDASPLAKPATVRHEPMHQACPPVYAQPGLTKADIHRAVKDAMDAHLEDAAAESPVALPAQPVSTNSDDAHQLLDFALSHPEQHAALMPVIAKVIEKSAKATAGAAK